ncbi:MAG: type II toxin-antitoxin system Y4mF family antitoxin [Actinomycetota bacterium]
MPNQPEDRAWLGEHIRSRRRSLGLTQGELADLAGASPRFVRAVETGKSSVRLDKLLDLLEVLGLEIDLRQRDGA